MLKSLYSFFFSGLGKFKMCRISSTLQDIASHILRCVLQHYLRSRIVEPLSVNIFDIFSSPKVLIENVHINLNDLTDLPFTITDFVVETVVIKAHGLYDISLELDGIKIYANVCNLPKTSQDDNDIEKDNDDPNNQDYVEKDILDYEFTEAIDTLKDFVEKIITGIKLKITDVTIVMVTELGVSHTSREHEMELHIEEIKLRNWNELNIIGTSLAICPPELSAWVPCMLLYVTKDGEVTIDFSQTENNNVFLCGDSYFIISFFVQLFLENQRYISKQKAPLQPAITSVEIAQHISETLKDNIRDKLDHITNQKQKKKKQKEAGTLTKLNVTNLDITIDFHRGSDLQQSRMETNKMSVRVYRSKITCDFVKDIIVADVDSIQSTIGYIKEPIRMELRSVGTLWDAYVNIPQIYIETSQRIVDNMMVLLNFNILWNDYDLLYNSNETIKFRHVVVEDIHVSSTYYNSPVDVKKIFKGNWRSVLKLIPPCNISLTLPKLIMSYHVGWEDVLDKYITTMVHTQKMKCAKKVIIGVAKRKARRFLHF